MTKRILLFFSLLALCSCGGGERNSYFPLGDGSWWEYAIHFEYRGEQKQQRQIFANQDPVDVDGQRYFPRRSASNHIDYFQRTDEGIYHIDPIKGGKTWILQRPYKVGTEWKGVSKISKLELLGGAFTATYLARIKHPVEMTYRIESLDDDVEANGVHYTHCLKVRAQGRLYAGSDLEQFVNISSINIDMSEWYAPGIGLVKRIRKEFTAPNEFKNVFVQELLLHKRG